MNFKIFTSLRYLFTDTRKNPNKERKKLRTKRGVTAIIQNYSLYEL